MSLPDDLQTRLDDPDFWRAYFFESEDEDDLDEEDEDSSIRVEFPVGGGYALELEIDLPLRLINLGMRSPESPEILEIGWDDDAHWHPDALRWDELDLIARAAAVLDPTLRHPGPVVSLACRFVVLGPDDDLDRITPLLDAAFGPPPPGADWWPATRDRVHRCDGRHNGITWQQSPTGDWTVDQDESLNADRDLYSTRRPGGSFPFTPWRSLLTAAESTLATASPTTGSTPTTALSAAPLGTTTTPTPTPTASTTTPVTTPTSAPVTASHAATTPTDAPSAADTPTTAPSAAGTPTTAPSAADTPTTAPSAAGEPTLTTTDAAPTTMSPAAATGAGGPALPVPINAVEECWVEETRTGAPRGSLIAARFGPSPLRDSRSFTLSLTLSLTGRRPTAFSTEVREDLESTLRAAGLGSIEEIGSISTAGVGWTAALFDITVIDDLDAGIALIRAALHRHSPPAETRLTYNRQPIPLT